MEVTKTASSEPEHSKDDGRKEKQVSNRTINKNTEVSNRISPITEEMMGGFKIFIDLKGRPFSKLDGETNPNNENENQEERISFPDDWVEKWNDISNIQRKAYMLLDKDMKEKGKTLDELKQKNLNRKPKLPTPFPPRHEISYFMVHVQDDYFRRYPNASFPEFKTGALQKWNKLDKKKKKPFILKASGDLIRHADEVEQSKVVDEYNLILNEIRPRKKRRTIIEMDAIREHLKEKKELKQRQKALKEAKRKLIEQRKEMKTQDGRRVKQKLKKWDKDVPKVSHAKGPYACFFEERWQQQKLHKKEKMTYRSHVIGNFAKATGAAWKALTDEEKKPYKQMSREARKKKLKEVDAWWAKNPDGPEIRAKYKPLKPRSALVYYMVDEKIKSWQSSSSESHEEFKERTRSIWEKLPEWMKSPYEEKAKEDRIRYEQDNFEYEWVNSQKKLMVQRYYRVKAEKDIQARLDLSDDGDGEEDIPKVFKEESNKEDSEKEAETDMHDMTEGEEDTGDMKGEEENLTEAEDEEQKIVNVIGTEENMSDAEEDIEENVMV